MAEEPVKHGSPQHSPRDTSKADPAIDLVLPSQQGTIKSGASHFDTDQVILRAETLSKADAKVSVVGRCGAGIGPELADELMSCSDC